MAAYEARDFLRDGLSGFQSSFNKIKSGRNQDIEIQKRAWGSSTDLEQQQRSNMPNFSRPHNSNHPSYVQGYKGRAYTAPPSIAKSLADKFLRLCQLAFALTVAGLYGRDLQHACDKNVYIDAKWVFAEIVAALGAATSAAYLVLWCCVSRIARPALTSFYSMHFPLWLWEIFMCLLWLTLFGIFGKMYIPENPEGDLDIERMKHAVWVDLVNLLLWMATMVWSGLRWWQGRVKRNKEVESGGGSGKPSEMTKEFTVSNGAGAGAGHATPPVASGAAPISMPDPTSYGASRAAPNHAAHHDVSPVVSRQSSSANANGNSERRAVSPM